MSKVLIEKANRVLKKYWGFDSFLKSQEEIIISILEGKDTICLIPTGGGKSMCFQIPAIIKEGTCLVISPLIALITDQVQRLKSLGIRADGLHSGMNKTQQNHVIDKVLIGDTKLLYISPEKLNSNSFKKIIQKISVSFIAVDEAHCISQWGYDFRPDYLNIHKVKNILPNLQICAFTATANSKTLKDIKTYLSIKNPKTIRGSFLKKNIRFGVINTEKKLKVLELLIKEFEGSGIIYMRSRKGTVILDNILRKSGINSEYYHAGMNSDERLKVQSSWIKNKTQIIVSTTAFGMGIDKPDVRFVIHYDLPTSMEEYYQEAGRAGRDGNLSNAVVIYNNKDLMNLSQKSVENFPSIQEIVSTYNSLVSYCKIKIIPNEGVTEIFKVENFLQFNGFSFVKTYRCLSELERIGYISMNISLRDKDSLLKLNISENQMIELEKTNNVGFKILKAVVLIYEGLFITKTSISEEKIAKKLDVDTKMIHSILEDLSVKKIVDYEKRSDDILINFRNIEGLRIDEKALKFRKNRLVNNTKTIVKYLEFNKCRQINILSYFGEKLKKACNVCDICLETDKTKYNKKEFLYYLEAIDNFEFSENTDLDDLMYIDTYIKRNKNTQMLKSLIQSGKLSLSGDKVRKL